VIEQRMKLILEQLDKCRDSGKNVIAVAHAKKETYTHPNGKSWDTFGLDLSRRTQTLVAEWCDELLFCERDYTTKEVEQSFGRKQNVGVDRKQVLLHTEAKPYFNAKHRSPRLAPVYDLYDPQSYRGDLENE
jgi:hypothetical protein